MFQYEVVLHYVNSYLLGFFLKPAFCFSSLRNVLIGFWILVLLSCVDIDTWLLSVLSFLRDWNCCFNPEISLALFLWSQFFCWKLLFIFWFDFIYTHLFQNRFFFDHFVKDLVLIKVNLCYIISLNLSLEDIININLYSEFYKIELPFKFLVCKKKIWV